MGLMHKLFLSASLGLLAGLIFLIAPPAEAAIHNVTVNGSIFSPANLTIEVGDTVVWENLDDSSSHSTVSALPFLNPNYWNGLLVDQGDTFAHTFNNAGTFTYSDQFDTGTGTITVTPPAPLGIVLASPRKEGGQFLFEATGLTVGKTNVLEASTNLTSWAAIKTNVADNASMTFTNASALPSRFFRLVELP